jgi:molecular chaperone GrpE
MEIKIKDAKKKPRADAAPEEAPAANDNPAADAAAEPAAPEPAAPEPAAPEPAAPDAAADLTEEEKTYREQLLRMAADFDNYRKRAIKEKGEGFDRGVAALAEAMLPVLDNLDLALDHARVADGGGALCRGLEMVRKMFLDALEQQGIRPIATVGERFDPRSHEAIAVEPTADSPTDTVLGEFQRGYRHKERLLRPAKVRIAGSPAPGGEGSAVN